MRLVVVGLGIQGRKRWTVAGADAIATVDPVVDTAHYRRIEDVPLDAFDAAAVCTPDGPKIEVITYLLRNGKHVLVEKPLFASEETLRRLISLASDSGATCYTAYNHRFEPHIMRVRELLQQNAIGPVYMARFFYGNGTALDVKRSVWRDQGSGVLPDLGSHLLDMSLFLFGPEAGTFRPWTFNRFENQAFDHYACGSDGKPLIEFEMTLLSWRNTFTADIWGELGSIHIHGLCKWGPSVLTVRKRVFPSGRPGETTNTLESPDPTWASEYAHFKSLCVSRQSNLENDLWINSALNQLEKAS